MRYFPQRARKKTDLERNLNICTYCLGDMFADGRCVQCHARTSVAAQHDRLHLIRPSIAWQEPLSR
jgi:hypothetical protein